MEPNEIWFMCSASWWMDGLSNFITEYVEANEITGYRHKLDRTSNLFPV